MRYLKIKNNYDMRYLVDFGFKDVDYVNTFVYKYEDDYCNVIIGPDRIVHINHFTVNNTAGLSVIYDLIKSNIVEVVEDE